MQLQPIGLGLHKRAVIHLLKGVAIERGGRKITRRVGPRIPQGHP